MNVEIEFLSRDGDSWVLPQRLVDLVVNTPQSDSVEVGLSGSKVFVVRILGGSLKFSDGSPPVRIQKVDESFEMSCGTYTTKLSSREETGKILIVYTGHETQWRFVASKDVYDPLKARVSVVR